MIDKQCATEICDLAREAISELSQILNVSRGRCSETDYEQIKRGVGLAIGQIQTELLDVIWEAYPELDDLR